MRKICSGDDGMDRLSRAMGRSILVLTLLQGDKPVLFINV